MEQLHEVLRAALHGLRPQEADLDVVCARQQPGEHQLPADPVRVEKPGFDATKTHANGKKFTLEAKDINNDGVIDIDDLQWEYLDGDGDFRSQEVTALRDEADFVITNPPFSLFRPFMTWVVGGGRKLSVIGTNNAITYNEVFPHIMANELWKGATANSTDMVFGVPKGTPVADADRLKAERLGYPPDDERDYTRHGNSCWFTNIDHGRRHEPLQLMTTADNIKFSRHKEVRGVGYPPYDNFDAIEVPFIDAIPSDHDGMMGVPITFLDSYDPDQFEIVGSSEGDYPANEDVRTEAARRRWCAREVEHRHFGCFVRAEAFGPGTYFDVGYPVKRIYKRLFIRRKADS